MSGNVSELTKGLVKGGVSWLLPGSSPVLSIFDELRTGEYKRRFEDWQQKVDNRLEMITDIQLQQLKDNSKFATVLFITGQLALKTEDSKRTLLANAVANSAITSLSEERVVLLLNCIEKYTIPHLRLLRFLQNPQDYNPRDFSLGGAPISAYDDYYPNRDKSIDGILFRDLYNDGLITTDTLNSFVSGDGVLEKRTTQLGDDMICFFGIEKDNI